MRQDHGSGSAVSMTGVATRSGSGHGAAWGWEIRGVNGKGLDVRLRLPEGIDGLEAGVRARATARISRGNITISLRLTRDEAHEAARLNTAGLDRVLDQLAQIEQAAAARGLVLAQTSAAQIAQLRGVLETGAQVVADPDGQGPLRAALLTDFDELLTEFDESRRKEGSALVEILRQRLVDIEGIVNQARFVAEERRAETGHALDHALARLEEARGGRALPIEPERVAQELALAALKGDVTEELDRLCAHVLAARALLGDHAPIGRRLDFLAQEFTREANTLCSKSGSTALTALGLDLKHAIDQMREQIQNLE
ncbi:YicC/YloC family endoribonuclease [Phaeovulum vinaykumarii]|uniref:TIGR00255 family protein n=1 Tax=Phaeovulum vinaykumarii TaxID=407234 RepID=A0A1N7LIM5_9RHOB|nr:YicC/YloC family endoribonuclease [Phaeovulum vinaykumarii]SIS73656.1 TIGR00255 family protein [Phaeovulum vinaykumarii]SOC04738.1 uncharacterized protein (TIGR00255 family) [Phaeovulum vinaykumarii]